MASIHLTSNNGSSSGTGKIHLAGVDKDSSKHLVVVKQLTDWKNKEFVVAPKETRFAWAIGSGMETAQSTYASDVLVRTNDIVNNMNQKLSSSEWVVGQKALFQYITRRYDPYALWMDKTNAEKYTGCGASALTMKMDLRNLHVSKLSDFSAYLRVYVPSMVKTDPRNIHTDGSWNFESLYNNASRLAFRFSKEMPSSPIVEVYDENDGEADFESVELSSICNDERRTISGLLSGCLVYDPFDQFGTNLGGYCMYLPLRVWTGNGDLDTPKVYYSDVELSGRCLEFLRKGVGEFWITARFHPGNGFASDPPNMNACLQPYCTYTVYVQRLELVLKCTGGKFNS